MKLRIASVAVIAVSLLITGLVATPIQSGAFFSPPPSVPINDNFADATAFTGSFSDSLDDSLATLESGEPGGCFDFAGIGTQHTVWYKFTPPTSGLAHVTVQGDVYDSFFNVYTTNADPAGFANLSQVLCGSYSPSADMNAASSQTYYIQVGNLYGYQSGMFHFSLEFSPAPANDNFANVVDIPGIPFSTTMDNRSATMEPGETTCTSIYRTVWYKYTPQEARSILFTLAPWGGALGVYTGSAVNALTSVGCINSWGMTVTVVRLEAGKTYYVQLGDMGYGPGTYSFSMDVAPNPNANFYYYPGDSSIFDTVQFYDASSDPGGQGFQAWTWAFGDGASATGSPASHKYSQDGSYTVQHSATTVDGRSASVSQAVTVKTHDVAVTKLQAPSSAVAGQTKTLVVSVTSKRYDETVQITLYKSVPGGLTSVGGYGQYVPVRPPGGKATDFKFNYTFTPDDARVGKVTFKVVAEVVNARDALPADNEAVAPPTKITR